MNAASAKAPRSTASAKAALMDATNHSALMRKNRQTVDRLKFYLIGLCKGGEEIPLKIEEVTEAIEMAEVMFAQQQRTYDVQVADLTREIERATEPKF